MKNQTGVRYAKFPDDRDNLGASDLSACSVRCAGLTSLLELVLSLLLLAVPFHSVLVFPSVSVVKAIGFILVPIWLIWTVTKLGMPRGPWIMTRRNVRLLLSFGAFICSILLSLLYASASPNFGTSLMTIMFNAGMAVVICTLVSSEALLWRAYTYLTIGGTIAGVLVIVQFVAPQQVSGILGQRVFVEAIGVRATGPFRDPNYGALTLVVLACLSFYLALTCRKRWQRTLLFLGVAVEVAAVLLTFSRGAYVLLGFVGLAILWRERHRLHLWKAALVAMASLVLLATLGGGILDLVVSRAGTLAEFVQLYGKHPGEARQADLSLWYRFQLLRAGVKMAFEKFPLGVGWENFRYQVTRYSEEVPEQGAHNTYVAVAAELGLPGVLALACLLWALWASTGRLSKAAVGQIGLLVRGTRYGLLAVLIGGLFLTVLHEAAVWALIGLIMAQNQVVFRTAKGKWRMTSIG